MLDKKLSDKYGTLWSREELILAFELYCRIPFKKTKANNPQVIELAHSLGRSPASVARKLGNFGSFDPALQDRQITGLAHTGRLDAEVWAEFNTDWNRLVLEASRLKVSFLTTNLTKSRMTKLPCLKGFRKKRHLQKPAFTNRFFVTRY